MLGDFGETVTVAQAAQEMNRQVGTIGYMAPEILENWKVSARKKDADGILIRGTCYDTPADVFSSAVVLWECLTQRQPFAEVRHPTRDKPLLDADRLMLGDWIVGGLRPSDSHPIDGFSPKLVEVVYHGWQHDPLQRPSALEMQVACQCELRDIRIRKKVDNDHSMIAPKWVQT